MGVTDMVQQLNRGEFAGVSKEAPRLMSKRSAILWFTGLSGAGKSTLANVIDERLKQSGCQTVILDGDVIRKGLCSDLGFSEKDRTENIRRIGEVAKLFMNAGVFAITAFISPFRTDRERVRQLVPAGDFIEIYCKSSLEKCEERDVKGLYALARKGKIKEFTGISSPYEVPASPELILDTQNLSIDACVTTLWDFLSERSDASGIAK